MTGEPRLHRQDILAGDGTRLALYRVGTGGGTPVVLMPGTFSNHTFWLGTRGHGLAWSVARAGFEAVVVDPRGHGASEPRQGRAWRFDDWGRVDLPAVIGAATPSGRPCLLVGHSAGGASVLMALAAEPELRRRIAGAVVAATPLPWLQAWGRAGAWAIRAATRLLGRFPARRLGLGPEDEMPGVMAQWMTWHLRRVWVGDDGVDYHAGLRDVRVPLLGVSGAGDTRFAPPRACRALVESVGSPDRTYVLAGRETGFSEDFDHAGIIVSRAARSEVWPLIIDWLRARDPGPRGDLPGA